MPSMPSIEVIRDALPEEVTVLEALQFRASTVYESDRDQVMAHPEVVAIPGDAAGEGRLRVAVGAGSILGFSLVLAVADGGCELDGLFVEPGRWRRGTGAALVDDAGRRASERGADRLDVVANPNALGFYEKAGFRVTGEVHTRFGPGLRMTLALDAPPR